MNPIDKSHKPVFSWLPPTIQIIAVICLAAALLSLGNFPDNIVITLSGIVSAVVLFSLSLIVKAVIIYIDKNE